MSSDPESAVVTNRSIPLLLACLDPRDLDRVITRFALPGDIVERATVDLEPDMIRAIGELAEQLSGDPILGLRAVDRLPRGSYGVIEFAVRNATDLRQAASHLLRFHRLINDLVAFTVDVEDDGSLILENRFLGDPEGLGRHGDQFTIGVILRLMRQVLSQPDLAPSQAWFIHARPSDPTGVAQWFGSDHLEFGRDSNGMRFDPLVTHMPIPGADSELLPILEDHARMLMPLSAPTTDLLAKVRVYLRRNAGGPPTLDSTAKAMRMSQRTLQRRLRTLGTTFNRVLDGVRSDLAHEYVQDQSLSLGEVAYLLGYSDARAFLRAFKRWRGDSPHRYRTRLEEEGL